MFISDVLQGKNRAVVKVAPGDSVLTAVRKLADNRIGAVIVEDDWMRLVGIFSERDFVQATAQHGAETLAFPVERLMSKGVVTCRPSDRIEDALGAMTVGRMRHLPVVDGGALVGIVSIGDLVKHRLDEKALEANVLLDLVRLHA